MNWSSTTVIATLIMAPTAAMATGHGPVYGLATPTLGKGAWNLDTSVMYRLVGDTKEQRAMLRPLVSYGITEDVQVSLSLPLPLYSSSAPVPQARMMAMMPSTPDAELLVGWRFQRNAVGIGSRFETTAYFGLDYPTDAVRGGIKTAPGFSAGAVTGYASRSIYAWVGAIYRRYMTPIGRTSDHSGDLLLYSIVVGYRPPFFRQELPHADWRLFVEAVGEYAGQDRAAGNAVESSGGHQILIGPTVLGLFGAWGISGGPLFPIYTRLNGSQSGERVRAGINFTYWWF